MNSPWVDVAVAVVFVFFVFSMIVSALNELVNFVGQVRSKQLWQALHAMASAGAGYGVDHPRAGRQLTSRLLAFALGVRETFFRIPTGRTDHRPLVRPMGDLRGVDELLSVLRATSAVRSLETADGGRTAVKHIPPSVFAEAVVELVDREGELDRVLDGIDPASPLRRKLEELELVAIEDRNRFRTEVAGWFDDQMSQLSRRYRKDVRRVMFALGLIVAVGANLDAIHVVASAQRDSDLRQALVVSGVEAAAGDGALCPDITDDADGRLTCVRDQIARARALRITTFWGLDGPCRDGTACSGWVERAANVVPSAWDKVVDHPFATLGRVIGWLLAAAALSFGAAFWFDLLRRAVGYRRVLAKGA